MTLTWNQYTHLNMYWLLIFYKEHSLIGPQWSRIWWQMNHHFVKVEDNNLISAYHIACRFTYIQINALSSIQTKHVPRNMTGGGTSLVTHINKPTRGELLHKAFPQYTEPGSPLRSGPAVTAECRCGILHHQKEESVVLLIAQCHKINKYCQ